MLLAGDIGGTKTDLAVYSSEAGPYAPLAETEVHSADYGSLEAIAREFLTKVKGPVDRACLPLPGRWSAVARLPQAYRALPEATRLAVRHEVKAGLSQFETDGRLAMSVEMLIGAGRA